MTRTTLVIGAAMMLVGSGAFMASNEAGTLITLAFGLVVVILATGAMRSKWTAPIMHMVVGLTFMGMLFSASSVPRLVRMMGGATVDMPFTVVATSILAVLCLIHVTMSIRWFLARKRLSPS
ncbi:MAG: hypothetical protein EHM43_00620 [Ignavibacteriae bacterium]|nr:MAG: hypothetical protein EHM43_00620 [Ignavibacteriota bacterium]